MDLAGFPATEQKALLDAGRASCRELLASCRYRAELTEPVVNAIPTTDWEAAEASVLEIQNRLADPDLYQDPDRAAAVVAEHEAAKDAAARLMAEWERISTRLGG